MSVLVVFAACAAACERDNPGFKLKDTSAEIGESTVSTTSVSSPTVTSDSDSTTAPTTTTTTSTTESLTVTSEGTTTTTLDPTTGIDPTETTGGMVNVVFPSSCDGKEIKGPYVPALVDTFFVNEPPGGNGCTLSGQLNTLCRDDEFGEAPAYELFYQKGAKPTEDLISLFAVRFPAPQLKYSDLPPELAQFEGLPVKQESWVTARVKLHVFRPEMAAEWKSMVLHVIKFAKGDVWEEGEGLEYTPCNDPASSFRCRKCKSEQTCLDSWSNPMLPYLDLFATVGEHDLKEPPGVDGLPIEIDLPADAVTMLNDSDGWLINEGMMLVPKTEVPLKVLSVKTVQAGKPEDKPMLRVLYCNPEITP